MKNVKSTDYDDDDDDDDVDAVIYVSELRPLKGLWNTMSQ
jgi:hypothetical protein